MPPMGLSLENKCDSQGLPLQNQVFSAWAFSSASVTNSSAEVWVASRSTGAARL
jgi:hypothetical protein